MTALLKMRYNPNMENTHSNDAERLTGLAPLAGKTAHTLILGSMPSVESLKKGQYYAFAHNRFWRVLFSLAGLPFDEDYAARRSLITSRGLALWDVIESCERKGSLDSDIRREKVNDIVSLVEKYGITRIVTNGGKAAQVFSRHFGGKVPGVTVINLPSTSPANARMSLGDLCAVWGAALRLESVTSDAT